MRPHRLSVFLEMKFGTISTEHHFMVSFTPINVSFRTMYTSVPMNTNYFLRRRDVRLSIYNKPTSRRIEWKSLSSFEFFVILFLSEYLIYVLPWGDQPPDSIKINPSPHDNHSLIWANCDSCSICAPCLVLKKFQTITLDRFRKIKYPWKNAFENETLSILITK